MLVVLYGCTQVSRVTRYSSTGTDTQKSAIMTAEVDCFTAMHTILHSFMKKGTYTDINFLIGESKIKAHKAILASCSTVFQTMFDTSMDEKESNEVVLTDVDEEVFSAFLDYIYVRDVKLVEKHTQGMLMLADKYDIEPLALLCDGLIEASLTSENAVESLFLADLYRRDALKTQVNLFIKQHLDDVSKNENWAKLDEHFDVMNGICHSFVLGNVGTLDKNSDEYTWTITTDNRGYNWMNNSGYSAPSFVQLVLRDCDPNIVINVKPFKAVNDGFLAIHIHVENKLNENFTTTFETTLMRNSVVTSRTKNFLSWAPNSTAEAKLAVVSNQMHSLSFPLKLTVAVKKTEPINQHPHLKMVKEHTQRFTDAVVIVGNVKFSVHKLVLAGKSEFFSELFVKHQNEYRIDDMAENTFKSLLEFMYSNCNPDKVDLALLRGAEQFKLHDLSRYLFSTLQKNITFDNAIEMCTKAEELKLVNFSSKVIEYMAKEPKTVLKSAKWPTMRNYPTVMKKLLYQMKKE